MCDHGAYGRKNRNSNDGTRKQLLYLFSFLLCFIVIEGLALLLKIIRPFGWAQKCDVQGSGKIDVPDGPRWV